MSGSTAGAGVGDVGSELLQPDLREVPQHAEDKAEDDGGEGRDDRHEAPSAEEGQELRKLDGVEAPVKFGTDDAEQDAAAYSSRPREGVIRPDELAEGTPGCFEQGLPDKSSHGGRTDISRKARRDANREQDREIIEEGATGTSKPRDIPKVRLAEPQRKTCRGQDCDRQHQRASDSL